MSLAKTQLLQSTLRSPLMHLPVLSAVFELPNARILFSPGSKLSAQQHQQAGAITDIVAPSLMHTAGVKPSLAAHPNARLWGPPGVREKHPDLKWNGILGVDAWPHEDELSIVPLDGAPKLGEVVFFHRASKALYFTDLVFNVKEPKGLAAWAFFLTFGTYKRFAVSKLSLRFVSDRPAFERVIAKLMQLDFEHVLPSHGEPVMNDAKPRLEAAFRERKLIA